MMFEEIREPTARVRALCEYGCQVEVDTSIAPRCYLRSGREMMRMASVYSEEQNLESAFILYSKFATLFVEKLPKHPDYKLSVTSAERTKTRKLVDDAFVKAEEIKQKLTKKYEIEAAKRREKEKREAASQREMAIRMAEQQAEAARRDAELRRQEASDHEMALRLHNEWQRPAAATEEEVTNVARRTVPTAPLVQPEDTAETDVIALALPSALKLTSRPSIDRSTKPPLPSHHFTSTGGVTGNRHGLRDVHVPRQLIAGFLRLAEMNSAGNIETCGILCGRLSHEAFRITHLLVPKQTATPDSCTTENEEEIFDYQDKFDLITLGWIHTHPSQTAFLSSVDLHSQYSYQRMLPEAIAIVCSVKFNNVAYFYLTPDHGLNYIANCRETGFHPHIEEPPLFEKCDHVKQVHDEDFIIADLRR